MTEWNLKELYSLVAERVPQNRYRELRVAGNSIWWKYALCSYHISEFRRIIDSPSEVDNPNKMVKAVGNILSSSAATSEGKEFTLARFKAEAHLIAFAHALHSISDITANVISLALEDYNLFSPGKKVYFWKLASDNSKLRDISPILYTRCKELYSSQEYKYLNDYVNITKHRSLVPSQYRVDFRSETFGLKIEAFERDGNRWDAKWVEDLIEIDRMRISDMIGLIGVAVNVFVRDDSA